MSFTLDQAMKAMTAMRGEANVPEGTLSLAAFVGMLSGEVEKLRAAGKTDEDIVQLIESASGAKLSVSELAENYASPAERHRA